MSMQDNFSHIIYTVSRACRQRFREHVGNDGLTFVQWRTLSFLSKYEMYRQIDLARLMEVKPITLARVVDDLEKLGLVVRVKDATDRRVFRLSLTKKAKPVLKKFYKITHSIEDEILEELTPEERKTLIALLLKLRRPLQV